MDENHRDAHIGFHSFAGTDYTSAFFKKGKKRSGPLCNQMITLYKLLLFLEVTGILTKIWSVFWKIMFVLFT